MKNLNYKCFIFTIFAFSLLFNLAFSGDCTKDADCKGEKQFCNEENCSEFEFVSDCNETDDCSNNTKSLFCNEGYCSEYDFTEICDGDNNCTNNKLSRKCEVIKINDTYSQKECRQKCDYFYEKCSNNKKYTECLNFICHEPENGKNCKVNSDCEDHEYKKKCSEGSCAEFLRTYGCEKDEDCARNPKSKKCQDKKCIPESSGMMIKLSQIILLFFFILF